MGLVNPVSPEYFVGGVYSSNSSASTSAAAAYEQSVAIQQFNELAAIGSSSSGSGSVDVGLNSADLLDLSPAALNILNGLETGSSANGLSTTETLTIAETTATSSASGTSSAGGTAGASSASGTSTTTGTSSSSGSGSTLTAQQQAEVAAIVAQYAASPVTPQTFTEISSALTAVGINPQQVSIQQLLTAYEYAYEPAFAFNGNLFTDTLASELDNA